MGQAMSLIISFSLCVYVLGRGTQFYDNHSCLPPPHYDSFPSLPHTHTHAHRYTLYKPLYHCRLSPHLPFSFSFTLLPTWTPQHSGSNPSVTLSFSLCPFPGPFLSLDSFLSPTPYRAMNTSFVRVDASPIDQVRGRGARGDPEEEGDGGEKKRET